MSADAICRLIEDEDARIALAQTCAFARTTYGLALRAGAMTIGEIRRRGRDVLVARYEPTPGNSFGTFLGGGVQLLENAIKGRDAAIPASAIRPAAARTSTGLWTLRASR